MQAVPFPSQSVFDRIWPSLGAKGCGDLVALANILYICRCGQRCFATIKEICIIAFCWNGSPADTWWMVDLREEYARQNTVDVYTHTYLIPLKWGYLTPWWELFLCLRSDSWWSDNEMLWLVLELRHTRTGISCNITDNYIIWYLLTILWGYVCLVLQQYTRKSWNSS